MEQIEINRDKDRFPHGNVILGGLTAAGKTTHAHMLAGEFGLQYVSSSQLLLSLLGFSPYQQREFWITEAGNAVWDTRESEQIDDELLLLEKKSRSIMFDTISMPWLHREPALVVWLESSLGSRVKKAIVSHRGRTTLTFEEIERSIVQKDYLACENLKKRYGFDLLRDREPFDVVIDISNCIASPTFTAALASISQVQDLLSAIVGWYFLEDDLYFGKLRAALANFDGELVRGPRVLLDAVKRLI